MKIALITEDGTSISRHFGRAPYYVVLTIEDGKVLNREMREKPAHNHSANEPHEHQPGQRHGFGAEEQDRHARMAQPIADCEAIICGGMGAGAYQSLQAAGIRPIVTDLHSIDEAARAYIEGKIVDHVERLH